MELQGMKTCQSCGYTMEHCECGRKKNTSGSTVKYQNYQSYPQESDYAMTQRISRTSHEEIKIMQELNPVDGEPLETYLKRKSIAEAKLTEYAITHHLYGTKRAWSCHTSSRYCFICTMAQLIDNNTAISQEIIRKNQSSKNATTYIISVVEDPNGNHTVSLQ